MMPFDESRAGNSEEARLQRFRVRLHAHKQQRIFDRPAGWRLRRWLPIASTLVIIGVLFFESRGAVIEADELVKQAASAELARPAGSAQRVRIKLTPANAFAMPGVGVASFTTEQELTDGIVASTAAVTLGGTQATLARLLAQHRFNWRQPLSVLCFSAWRSALPHKRDQVIVLNGSLFVLRTTTDEGDLREVELTIERDSYRVVREVLTFVSVGKLEIDAPAQWVRRTVPTPAAPATTTVAASVERAPRSRVEPSAPAAAVVPQPDLASWLDRRFGNTAARENFMPDLRRLTDVVHQHLESLRDLSGRYPGVDGAQASPAARARFQRQLDLQYQTLRADLDALAPKILTLTLQPRTMHQTSASTSKEASAPSDWSERIDAALPYAFRLDLLAGDLRAYDDLPTAVQQRLAETFDALWSAINAPAPESVSSSR